MGEPLHSFPADLGGLYLYLTAAVVVFVLMAALFMYALRNHKQLLLLFAGFSGMMALGVGLFSYANTWKLPTIHLYSNGLSTPQGKVSFDEIRKIELKDLEQHSRFPIQKDGQFITVDTQHIILVEEYSNKIHVIPSDNYPIKDIFGQLKILVEEYEAQQGKKNEG